MLAAERLKSYEDGRLETQQEKCKLELELQARELQMQEASRAASETSTEQLHLYQNEVVMLQKAILEEQERLRQEFVAQLEIARIEIAAEQNVQHVQAQRASQHMLELWTVHQISSSPI